MIGLESIKDMHMIHCVCPNRTQQWLTAMCLPFSASSEGRIRNLGLRSKIDDDCYARVAWRFVVLASHSPQLFLPPGIALSTHLPLEHHHLAAGAGQKEVLLGLVLRQRRAVARGSQLRRPIAPLFYPYQVSCSPDVVFSLLHSPPPMTWCKDKMNHD